MSYFKTTKIGYGVPDPRKPNFNTKIIPFEKCHNARNCEREDPSRNILSVEKFQKNEGGGDSLESLIKNFRKKKQKMRNFNDSLIVPKNLKKGTFWDFLTFVLLQKQKKLKGLFGDI